MGIFNTLAKKKKAVSETKQMPKTAKPKKLSVRTDGLYYVQTEKCYLCLMFHDDKTVSYASIRGSLDEIMVKFPNWRRFPYIVDEEDVIHFYDDIRDRKLTAKAVEDGIVFSLHDGCVYHFYKKQQ